MPPLPPTPEERSCGHVSKLNVHKDSLLVPLQNAILRQGTTAQNHSPRKGKHHGSQGRRRRKKGGEKLPNLTSETHRKRGFLIDTCPNPKLLSPVEKEDFLATCCCCCRRKNTAPEQGNTMAVKDGEGAKKAAKNSLT